MSTFDPIAVIKSGGRIYYGQPPSTEIVASAGWLPLGWLGVADVAAHWFGYAYGYGLSERLLLLRFPNDPAENGLWLFRIGLLLVLFGSTAWLAAYLIRKPKRHKA
jgi:hypothetical protein